ncbi:MAG: SUMF1/EgtB/PvdO family nonheme iron enzyme, partial [Planctomycetota bacterium]|nr:SUMF1/EgtB/PvdO family nonheme iron enzyme [Planctomycetota bacterium]
MTRSSFGWFVVGVAVLWMPSWAMAGAEADYKTLFGEDEEKAFVSEDPKVSAHFAAKLLNAARGVGKEEHLQILLCEKAYEFGMKEYSGYQTAMEAMKFLPKIAPDKRTQAQEKFLEAGQLRLAKSTGADRQALGGEMVDLLVVCGDERAAAKKPADAVGLYRKALSIATESGADRTRQIMEKIKQASSILDAEGRLEGLKNKLNENPKSIAARTSLILAYLGELDAPAEAVKLLNNDLEEKFRTYVPLSVKPVADLEVGVCLELATWYMEIAERATADGKCMLLGKSKACCERYLELHTDQDTPRLKGTMLLEKITKAAEKAAPEFSKTLTLDLGKGIAMKLVLIPAGKFMMGSPETEKDRDANEGPQRAAAITKTFYMGACEVTQEQFQAVMG